VAFESGSHPRNIAHHDGGKECHLVGKARIDRRLPGASNIGDLVDAGARESAFDKRAGRRSAIVIDDLRQYWIAMCLGPYVYALNDLITWR